MKKLEQAQQPLYAIEVPGDATDFDIVNNKNFEKCIIWNYKCTDEYYKLPSGNWQIVGTATKDHIDFDVTEFLDCVGDFDDIPVYAMYGEKEGYCSYADESFRSLLAANDLYFENPLGEEPQDIPVLVAFAQSQRQLWKEWQQAQQKVVEKLVFIKPV